MSLKSVSIGAAAFGAIILSAGCARVEVRLNAYLSRDHAFPKPDSGDTIGVVVETVPDEPLLSRELESKLTYMLKDAGYTTAPSETCDYILIATAAVDSGTTGTGYEPVTTGGGVVRTYVYRRHRRRRGGVTAIDTYYPPRTSYVPYTYTLYTRSLGLTLARRDLLPTPSETKEKEGGEPGQDAYDAAIVWRSTAYSTGETADLRWIVNHLLVASSSYFGKDTGREVEVTIAQKDERVMELAELNTGPS
ncbi:MAG: hypothetical protein ACE5E1_03445 [Phycisphaerae bacterium]